MSCWNKLETAFPMIIKKNNKYENILNHIGLCNNNFLLYVYTGFPLDLYIDEILKHIFNMKNINRTSHTWNKTVIYNENQYFFEIDLLNPESPKDLSNISAFILHIIQTKNIGERKHFIIIKHIEYLSNNFYEFRILLERYSQNVIFMCTTHSLSKIEAPIKSRFTIFKIPLFTSEEIQDIFINHLKVPLNSYMISMKSRDIIKAVFLADIELQELAKIEKTRANQTYTKVITKEFCMYNFPPLYEFIKTYDKSKDNLEEIRNLSYKCCQYNVSILKLIEDLIKIIEDDEGLFLKLKYPRIPQKKITTIKHQLKMEIVKIGAEIEHLLCQTNKGREPIYIEHLLCQILI